MDSLKEVLKEGVHKNYFKISDDKITYLSQKFTDNITDPEEEVRAGLYFDLIEKYGYKNDPEIIDLEFNRVIGHPYKKNSSRLDLIIYRPDKTPFAIFELKSEEDYDKYFEDSIKTQLFERAANEDKGRGVLKYLIYYTRYYEDGQLTEKFETIDYNEYKDWDSWEKAGRPNLRRIPKNYDIIDRPPQFIKGSPNRENQLREDVKKAELARISEDLHNVLWGGGRHQNELFFNLIALFITKIYDEKTTNNNKPYRFQIFYEGKKEEKPSKVYERINKLFRGEKNKDTGEYSQCALNYLLGFTDEMLDKQSDIVFDENKVKYVVELLQDISFTSNKYDVLGDFFERIVRREIKETKGQFLTHQNIVNFIVKAIQIEELAIDLMNGRDGRPRLPYLIDPSSGSGTFQIACMKAITNRIRKEYYEGNALKQTDDTLEAVDDYFLRKNKNKWAKEFIYGLEINNDLAMATKVNMVGHGDGSANIFADDGLIDFEKYHSAKLQVKKKNSVYEKYVNEQFDIVVSNPPFSITVDKETAKQLPNLYLQGKKIEQSLKKVSKKEVDTELLFLERYYQLLKPNGRLGVVLPESVFDSTSNRTIRLFLFKYFKIKAIVSLPHLAFAPYTMTKTSLLFAQKKTEDEVKEWDKYWKKFEGEFDKLKKELDKVRNRKETDELKPVFIKVLKQYLLNWFEDADEKLSISALKDKYSEEIKNVDVDWWVFNKVSEAFNYNIFMAHAEEIGYKRGTLKEEERPNELFTYIDDKNSIKVDTANPEKIIDHFYRNVVWE